MNGVTRFWQPEFRPGLRSPTHCDRFSHTDVPTPKTAGINPDHTRPYTRRRRPNKRQMLDAIIERSQQGLSLRWRDVCRENFSFAYAVKNSFGSWGKALVAAGLVSQPSQRKPGVQWDREKVIAALRARKKQGLRMNRFSKDDAALASTARRYFGSLRDAVLVAGIANVGYQISDTTVGNTLKAHGIEPAPDRQRQTTWATFLKAHWDVLAAIDFTTIEVWTRSGLVMYYLLFVMELKTRRIHFAGCTPNPDQRWMRQIARNLTDPEDGFLKAK